MIRANFWFCTKGSFLSGLGNYLGSRYWTQWVTCKASASPFEISLKPLRFVYEKTVFLSWKSCLVISSLVWLLNSESLSSSFDCCFWLRLIWYQQSRRPLDGILTSFDMITWASREIIKLSQREMSANRHGLLFPSTRQTAAAVAEKWEVIQPEAHIHHVATSALINIVACSFVIRMV